MSFYKYETIASLGHAGFAGTYTTVVTTIPSEAIEIIVTTTLDESVMLSFDGGVTDHVAIPKTADAGGPIRIELACDCCRGYSYHAGSAIKVKDIGTPTAGSIYISIRSRV